MKRITKIYEITIDDTENIHLVIPMYNLLEYTSNYSDTISSLFFSKNEATDFDNNYDIDYDFENSDEFKLSLSYWGTH